MKKIALSMSLIVALLTFLSMQSSEEITTTYNLRVKVNNLRNSKGHVQFALYNKDRTIPDEKYKKYYRKKIGTISNHSAYVIFKNLTKGRYAVNILHDENKNGKIDKGWVLPIEGIGFSNQINWIDQPS